MFTRREKIQAVLARAEEILELREEYEMAVPDLQKRFDVSRTVIERALKKARQNREEKVA